MGKQMRKSENLLDITEVCNYFGLSESTIRRKIRASREGHSNFPIPLFKEGHRVLWRKCDIENWGGDDCEVITLAPSLKLPPTSVVQKNNLTTTRKQLAAEFGIRIPKEVTPTVNITNRK